MDTKLVLHAGAEHVALEALATVPTPDATETWQPVPHATLVQEVKDELAVAGYQVTREEHALWKGGLRYFGLIEISREGENQNLEYTLAAGLRNSHDKTFPAALALGNRVFVCDNLAFSGEVQLTRKHTRYVLRDLPALVGRGVGQLAQQRVKLEARITTYKTLTLTDKDAHDILVRAIDRKVIAGQALPHVLQEWRHPQHEEFASRTGWSLFNSFTEVLKGTNPGDLPRRTMALYGLMDQVTGLLGPGSQN